MTPLETLCQVYKGYALLALIRADTATLAMTPLETVPGVEGVCPSSPHQGWHSNACYDPTRDCARCEGVCPFSPHQGWHSSACYDPTRDFVPGVKGYALPALIGADTATLAMTPLETVPGVEGVCPYSPHRGWHSHACYDPTKDCARCTRGMPFQPSSGLTQQRLLWPN